MSRTWPVLNVTVASDRVSRSLGGAPAGITCWNKVRIANTYLAFSKRDNKLRLKKIHFFAETRLGSVIRFWKYSTNDETSKPHSPGSDSDSISFQSLNRDRVAGNPPTWEIFIRGHFRRQIPLPLFSRGLLRGETEIFWRNVLYWEMRIIYSTETFGFWEALPLPPLFVMLVPQPPGCVDPLVMHIYMKYHVSKRHTTHWPLSHERVREQTA